MFKVKNMLMVSDLGVPRTRRDPINDRGAVVRILALTTKHLLRGWDAPESVFLAHFVFLCLLKNHSCCAICEEVHRDAIKASKRWPDLSRAHCGVY